MDAIHPDHYRRGGMECKDVMRAMMYGADVTNAEAYWWGTALKYLWRWPYKNGVQDLQKARECIDQLIRETEHEATD